MGSLREPPDGAAVSLSHHKALKWSVCLCRVVVVVVAVALVLLVSFTAVDADVVSSLSVFWTRGVVKLARSDPFYPQQC